jgi:hypothetical protein
VATVTDLIWCASGENQFAQRINPQLAVIVKINGAELREIMASKVASNSTIIKRRRVSPISHLIYFCSLGCCVQYNPLRVVCSSSRQTKANPISKCRERVLRWGGTEAASERAHNNTRDPPRRAQKNRRGGEDVCFVSDRR